MATILKPLEPPYEIFELLPGETRRFRALKYEVGLITIHPRWPGAPPEKTVKAVRVHTDVESKPVFPHYWDITAGTLVPQVLTVLVQADVPRRRAVIEVTKIGAAPKARFSVRLIAIE